MIFTAKLKYWDNLAKARSPTKILAEKSVYSPWLIYKFIIHEISMVFPCVGSPLSIVQKRLRYHFETLILTKQNFSQSSAKKLYPFLS